MIRIEAFADRAALAQAAAAAIADRLKDGGLLVAAGGSTPGPVYDRLSRTRLAWDAVTVTLTDERRVDPTSADSNEALIRARLLTGAAAAAHILPLRCEGLAPLEEAMAAHLRLAARLPAACVLLGMGEDGHVASLFPGAPELAAGLDPDGERLVLPVAKAGLAPFKPRLTLTFRALTETRLLILLVTGGAKRRLIERIGADPDYSPPVAAFLRQDRCPVRVMWAA